MVHGAKNVSSRPPSREQKGGRRQGLSCLRPTGRAGIDFACPPRPTCYLKLMVVTGIGTDP